MAGSFAGFSLFEPKRLVEACNRGRHPLDWIGQANRFDCATGHLSGTGNVLLIRSDLDKIDVNAEHDLTFAINGESIKIPNLHIAGDTRCLTPGSIDSPDAVHLVPLGDRRRLWQFAAMNRAYNLRLTPNGEYVESTATDSATGYSWAEVWSDLKGRLPDGVSTSVGSLPYEPADGPENLAYWGWTVGDAIGNFLSRLGCTLAWNPIADVYTVAQLGEEQAGLTKAENKLAKTRRLRSLEPVSAVRGVVPASVQVLFTKSPGPRAYGQSPYLVIEVDNADAEDGETGVMMIKDDLLAQYAATTLQNLTALQDRADERAAEFFRVRRDYVSEPHRKTYSGIVDSILPGSMIASVTWGDVGAGMITETRRITYRDPVQAWPSTEHQAWRLWEWVRVMAAPGAGSDVGETIPTGYQSGRVTVFNPTTNLWEPVCYCWWRGANDETGIEDWRYWSRFKGQLDGRPVYVGGCCKGTEGGVVAPDDGEGDGPTEGGGGGGNPGDGGNQPPYQDDFDGDDGPPPSPVPCGDVVTFGTDTVIVSNRTGSAVCLANSLETSSPGAPILKRFNAEPAGGGAPTCSGNPSFDLTCVADVVVLTGPAGTSNIMISASPALGIFVFDIDFGTTLDTLGIANGTARVTISL